MAQSGMKNISLKVRWLSQRRQRARCRPPRQREHRGLRTALPVSSYVRDVNAAPNATLVVIVLL